MSVDRFDLEQQILDCWTVTNDIEKVYEAITDGVISKDQASNILLGMRDLYNLKFDGLFRTFEQLIGMKKIT
jgi:hypothetical protein